jgi:hypothetical protein
MNDPCYGLTKPLTREVRQAFVADVSPLAVKAEADHGVPAPILVNRPGFSGCYSV